MQWQQFFFRYFKFPSISCVHEAHSYRQSLLEGHSNCQSTHLSYIHRIRGGIPIWIIFHSFPTYETLTGDPLTTICLSSDLSIVPGETQSPIYDLGPSLLQYMVLTRAQLYTYARVKLLYGSNYTFFLEEIQMIHDISLYFFLNHTLHVIV